MATCTTASLAKRLEKLLAARAPSAAGPTVHDVARYRAYLEGKGPRPADVMRRYYLEPTAAGAKAAVEAARQVFHEHRTGTGRFDPARRAAEHARHAEHLRRISSGELGQWTSRPDPGAGLTPQELAIKGQLGDQNYDEARRAQAPAEPPPGPTEGGLDPVLAALVLANLGVR